MARLTVFRFAARSLFRRKRKNALAFTGVLLGVILLVSIGTVMDSANKNFKDLAIRATGNADISITSAVGGSFPAETLSTVKSVESVTDVAGRITGQGTIYYWNETIRKEEKEDVSILGVAQGDYDYVDDRYTKITGTRVLEENQVIVDARFDLSVGDTLKIRVLGEYYTLVVVGVYNPPPLVKGLGEIGKRIYIDLPMAQRAFKVYGRLTSIIAKIEDFREVDRVVERLESLLGYRYKISAVRKHTLQQIEDLMEGYALDSLFYVIIVFTIAVVLIFNMQYMNMKGRRTEIGILRSLGMSKIQVFLMLVTEALFLGAVASLVGTIIGNELARLMAEAFINPVAGFILSSPETASSVEYTEIIISEIYIATGVLIGPTMTVIATVIPSLMASRESIVETVQGGLSRTEEKWLPIFFTTTGLVLLWAANNASKIQEPGTMVMDMSAEMLPVLLSFPAFILGGVALAAGLLKIYAVLWRHLTQPFMGRLGSLMARSVGRNTTRTAVSLALVSIALTFYLIAAFEVGSLDVSLERSMERLFPADIVVFSEEKIPADYYRRIQGVGRGNYVKYAAATISFETKMKVPGGGAGNYSAPMMGIDVRYFPKVIDVRLSEETPPSVFYELMQPNTIMLSRPVATSLGDLGRGSVVEILSTEGIWFGGQIYYVPVWRAFTVIGIAEANPSSIFSFGTPSLGDPCYVSYSTLTEQFGHIGDYATVFFVEAADEYKNQLPLVKDAISERFMGEYSVGIITRQDLLDELQEHMNEELALFEVMKVAGFGVCVLGVAVMANMNIDDRKRELAILRSVGCSHRQLAIMILVEVVAVTLLGLVISLPISIKLYQIIVEWASAWGFEMIHYFSFEPIQIAAVSAFTMGVLGAIYPAYRTTRLSIIETLRTER